MSEWLPWEQCDSSCNNKFRRRRRIVETPADGIRKKRALCPNLVEEEPCPCYFQDHDIINGEKQYFVDVSFILLNVDGLSGPSPIMASYSS